MPAYLSLLVAGTDTHVRAGAIGRALTTAAAMTIGFVAIFGVFGLVLAPVAGQIQQHLPWFTVVLGILLAVMGGWLLTGRDLPGLRLHVPGQGGVTRTWPSMIAYGMAYAAASLSYTIGPFLAIVVASARTGSGLEGASLFVAYAAGMGLVVAGAAVAVALAHASVLGRVRRLAPVISRLAGALLVAAGVYIAYYGWYEIRLFNGGSPDDPVISAATDLQGRLADTLDTLGAPALAGIVVALVGVGLVSAVLRRRHSRSGDLPG